MKRALATCFCILLLPAAFSASDVQASRPSWKKKTAQAASPRERATELIRSRAREVVAIDVAPEANHPVLGPRLEPREITQRAYESLVDQLVEQVESFETMNAQTPEARVRWEDLELRIPPFWTASTRIARDTVPAKHHDPRVLARALALGVARFVSENPSALPRIRIEMPKDADPELIEPISRAIRDELEGDAYLSSTELRGFTRMKSTRRSLERRAQLGALAEQVQAANASMPEVRIAAHSRSSSPGQASGDFAHVAEVDGKLHILVADVAGKGKVEPVARESLWFGSELRFSQDFRMAMQASGGEPVVPLRFVEGRVREYQKANPGSAARQEVAATYCIYDPRTRVLKAAFGGGMFSVGIFKADGRVTYLHPPKLERSSNSALGLLPRETIEQTGYDRNRPTIEIQLEEGDLFAVLSDGFHDAPSNQSLRAGANLLRLLEAPKTSDPSRPNYGTFPVRKLLRDPEALIRLMREEGNLSSRVFVKSGDDTTAVAVQLK